MTKKLKKGSKRIVSFRTLWDIVCTSLLLCLGGVLVDLDKIFYLINSWDANELHCDLRLQLIFCGCISIIAGTYFLRLFEWGKLESLKEGRAKNVKSSNISNQMREI